jgi:aryl-alcohol dehydrogenase-like predicted oxidoreductase
LERNQPVPPLLARPTIVFCLYFQKMEYRSCYDPAPKPMTLGSVQFGLDYGIVNTNGKVPESESIAIIRHAIVEGIEYIDTAAAYGDSERIIGKSLADGWSNRVKVISKLFPFNEKELSEKHDSSLSLVVKLVDTKNLKAEE